MEPDQVKEFGYRVLREFKIREHEFFADFCQTYLLDHPDDYGAVCRFIDEMTTAREARAARTDGQADG